MLLLVMIAPVLATLDRVSSGSIPVSFGECILIDFQALSGLFSIRWFLWEVLRVGLVNME